ncbi:MAG: hypothetical protein JRC77_11575 [Deltaproteobacteria bacterium]|nr:hypothetical protein [Deltaproteobacteria bacterium]
MTAGTAEQRVGGDTCASPTEIPGLPYADTGDTDSFEDDYDEECPGDALQPDVVYSYTPPSDVVVDISLCGSGYDTKLYVYEGFCPDVGNPFACNDDACGGTTRSELQGVYFIGGVSYYIVVDGWGLNPGGSGPYNLIMSHSSVIFMDGFESGDTLGWSSVTP